MSQPTQLSCRAKAATLLQGFLLLIVPIHVVVATNQLYDCGQYDSSFCQSVSGSECQPLSSSNCTYGLVKQKDGCCYCDECAKGPGESCGSVNGSKGICAEDHTCIVYAPYGDDYEVFLNTPGICKPNEDAITMPTTATIPTDPVPTDPENGDCRNECSVEFCMDGRNRYCSATENAFEAQDERGACQHTTCKACRLLVSPICPTCPVPVRKRCLRKYFLCIAQHYKEDKIMLELSDPLAQNVTGIITCHVPEVDKEISTSGDTE